MAHNKNRNRGLSSHARRAIREESFIKTINRKRNHEGCTARSRKTNGKD